MFFNLKNAIAICVAAACLLGSVTVNAQAQSNSPEFTRRMAALQQARQRTETVVSCLTKLRPNRHRESLELTKDRVLVWMVDSHRPLGFHNLVDSYQGTSKIHSSWTGPSLMAVHRLFKATSSTVGILPVRSFTTRSVHQSSATAG